MTNQEFSDEFDVLLSSFTKSANFGEQASSHDIVLDEYEKSVFLSKAQEEIVINLYNGKNVFGESFEKTEELRRYLSDIVETVTLSTKIIGLTGLTSTSVFYMLPVDLWFITYESVLLTDSNLGCLNNTRAVVIPVTQDQFYKINRNPFRGPSLRKVLRLDTENDVVELVSNYNIASYLIRYIRRPVPIVLEGLPTELSLNNTTAATECELSPALHRIILDRAVQLAIGSKFSNIKTN